MKIAYLSASGALGGAERVLLDLLAVLRRAEPGWSLSVISGADGPLLERAAALGVPAEVLAFPPALAHLGDAGASGGGRTAGLAVRALAAAPGTAAYLRRLSAALRKAAPDVVHSNGFKMHVLAALARPRGARLAWHLHDYVGTRRVMATAMRRLARRADAAIAVSGSVAEEARALLRADLPVTVVRNGIDAEAFSPDGPSLTLAAIAGLPPEPEGTVRVGLVATLGRWKGHDVFLRALAALPPGLPVRGYVVGGPIYQTAGSESSLAELRRLADELGLAGRVGFTGFAADPAAAMRALDVVVHASTAPEPFGLVIAEGMACGRAVVFSRAGGAAEVARDGIDALGCVPGDPAALAERIVRLAGDAELRARLGTAGRARVLEAFGRERMAGEVAAVYRRLAGAA